MPFGSCLRARWILFVFGLMGMSWVEAGTNPIVSPIAKRFLAQSGGSFDQYRPSFDRTDQCPETYQQIVQNFLTSGNAAVHFDRFIHRTPQESWSGRSKFELLMDRLTETVYDSTQTEIPNFREGQIVILTLSIGLRQQIPVAFEVIEVDSENQVISFSYLEQNITHGFQKVRFNQCQDQVQIIHETCFQSMNPARDRFFYPPIHKWLIRDFYRSFLSPQD